jgi:hypothetical protein
MNLDRFITVAALGVNALLSTITVCFVGPGFTLLSAGLFLGWLKIWKWEARR